MFTLASMTERQPARVIGRALGKADELGWNQSEFAQRLGVTPQDVTNWKKRDMPPWRYKDAAAALGWTVDALLGKTAGAQPGGSSMPITGALPESPRVVYVPKLAVAASMGPGADQANEEVVTGTLSIVSDWAAKHLPGVKMAGLQRPVGGRQPARCRHPRGREQHPLRQSVCFHAAILDHPTPNPPRRVFCCSSTLTSPDSTVRRK